MITDPKQYLIEQEQARKEYLQGLSVEESVRLLESLVTSGLVEEFTFLDDQPIGIALSIKNARKR